MTKYTWKKGPSTGKKRTVDAERKRKKSMTKTMEKRRRERNAWYCQRCSKKHYLNEPKYVVCESCFEKLKGVNKK